MGFRQRVYSVVRQIPAGRVAAYSDVASALGSPRAARQVGWALAALKRGEEDLEEGGPDAVPWQRVIRASGHIAFAGDPIRATLQRQMLEEEGVEFVGDAVQMGRFRWDPESVDLMDLWDEEERPR